MRNQKLYESVGKYIDKYYIDKPDDIKLDKEMKSIFDRISEFRKKKTTKKRKTKQLQNKRQFATDKQNYKKNATHKKNVALHTADITRQNFSADKKIYFQNNLTA